MHFALRKNINIETQPILRTTASMNLTGLEESKSQKDTYKTKTLGILNYVRILRDLTNKYGLEEPEFLTYNDFDIDKRIIFTSYCRIENQTVIATGTIAIITENEAAFKQIKLIQENYDLCEEKYENLETQKTKFQNKSTQTDFRPKLVPLCKICKSSNHLSNNCSKKSANNKNTTIFRKFLNLCS